MIKSYMGLLEFEYNPDMGELSMALADKLSDRTITQSRHGDHNNTFRLERNANGDALEISCSNCGIVGWVDFLFSEEADGGRALLFTAGEFKDHNIPGDKIFHIGAVSRALQELQLPVVEEIGEVRISDCLRRFEVRPARRLDRKPNFAV